MSILTKGTTNPVNYEEEVKRKYSKEDGSIDYDKLFQGRVEADRFIDQLKQENQGLRTDLNSRVTIEDSLSKLLERSTSNNNERRVEERLPHPNEAPTPPVPAQGVSKDDMMKMVREALETESSKAKRQSNLQVAVTELEKTFGPNYVEHVTRKAQDLGVPVEFFDKLASESPKALLALVSERNKEGNFSAPPVGSNVNASGGASSGKNYKYYENIRKSDPKSYWSPHVQNEMYANAAKLGSKFYD